MTAMNTSRRIFGWLVFSALLSLDPQHSILLAQGTTISYQGRLNDAGMPATGTYDLRFELYDLASNGDVVGGALTNAATPVTNGLFSVTLNFGAGIFTGPPRWLQLAVRTNGQSAFTTLLPRQPLLPVPYAAMANTASNLLGTVPIAQLEGTLPIAQLPGGVVTNGATGVVLAGAFGGDGRGLTNTQAIGWREVPESDHPVAGASGTEGRIIWSIQDQENEGHRARVTFGTN